MKSKEEILKKYYNTENKIIVPIIFAMQEYSDQQNAKLVEELTQAKERIESLESKCKGLEEKLSFANERIEHFVNDKKNNSPF